MRVVKCSKRRVSSQLSKPSFLINCVLRIAYRKARLYQNCLKKWPRNKMVGCWTKVLFLQKWKCTPSSNTTIIYKKSASNYHWIAQMINVTAKTSRHFVKCISIWSPSAVRWTLSVYSVIQMSEFEIWAMRASHMTTVSAPCRSTRSLQKTWSICMFYRINCNPIKNRK